MAADTPRASRLTSRPSFDTANSARSSSDVLIWTARADTTKPMSSDPLTRAQLELRITINDLDLQLARAQLQHWKRELYNCHPELYRLAVLAGEIKPTNSILGGYQPHETTLYDVTLVNNFVHTAQREVVKLERANVLLSRKLKDVMMPEGKNNI